MTIPATPDEQGSSTRPYLIRALHDWCTDNGFTPYIAVFVSSGMQVPMEYVKNNEIVLNVGFEATSGMKLGNEFIEFRARFGGVARDIVVPVDHVVAIYARENGQGMAFPVPSPGSAEASTVVAAMPAPETARTGLRLAGAEGRSKPKPETKSDIKPDSKLDTKPKPATAATSDEPPPPAPAPSGGSRPSLKRVK